MFQAVKRWIARGRIHADPTQLGLSLDAAPRSAEELLHQLRARGLRGIDTVTLTRNARVMVSFRGEEMRIHEGYLGATGEVLEAIVRLVEGRTKAIRRDAGKFVVAHSPATIASEIRRREQTHPDDNASSARLMLEHQRLNAEHFGGSLAAIQVRVSRRMKSRLGHYSPAAGKSEAEIAISRRHIKHHGWDDALDTLLHEMVHQWQAETGAPVDHGPEFRRQARAVGILPRAKRETA